MIALIMPLFAAAIILYGLFRRVPVFDCFVTGVKEGFATLCRIAPTILGLVFAVGLLRASGATEVIGAAVRPVAQALGFPEEIIPMALLRPVSGGGATALLVQVFEDCGPDSFAGRVASVLAGSSETTFYALTLYYGSVGIRQTRHTLLAAVAADVPALVMSVLTVHLFFSR